MKRDNVTPITEKPAIFSLFPESPFLKTIADVHELIASRAYELFSPVALCTVMTSMTGSKRNQN